ncbi:diversity-generating retroelement protein Avd [Roseofilum reptotaenium CS-1145]|uniref:Four helix bundle protein n=1 Tax=Roseofilum reptotaenium AO1-A TaxID=1925591 RepID=A0A1L9QXG4_9CYAN|nr:diversity-generating retroelement protein Avd [Roseofilum reptotaenium]MDB9519173.1 diversity-generating retroelement protein Avd [Roseofilum reptotaenium CS-1145]OJJ27316.1 four helix bundle protein [Roseofilum reptotaenium AO1-A]
MNELSIIQKTYDLIKWYVPILNRLPRTHKFLLGDRMIGGLYDLLENLIIAQYESEKLKLLIPLNSRLQILRYQTRLLRDFDLISVQRYEYVGGLMNEIGKELGGWIKQQQRREKNS